MSIESIVRRLRESRMNEAYADGYEYVFSVPWRECISTDQGEEYYEYRVSRMDYADEIMLKAKVDFNESDLAQYAARDRRIKDCGIKTIRMDFSDKGQCEVTVTTSNLLDDDQIEGVINYLEAQMSDGWGEGFEQRDIAKYRDESTEWVEDYEDEEEGGYYDTIETNYYVSGQFWWADEPYEIELISEPSQNESLGRSTGRRRSYKDIDEDFEDVPDAAFSEYSPEELMRKRDELRAERVEMKSRGKSTEEIDSILKTINRMITSNQDRERTRNDPYNVRARSHLMREGQRSRRSSRKCPKCNTPLNDAGKCPVCDDLDSRYGE